MSRTVIMGRARLQKLSWGSARGFYTTTTAITSPTPRGALGLAGKGVAARRRRRRPIGIIDLGFGRWLGLGLGRQSGLAGGCLCGARLDRTGLIHRRLGGSGRGLVRRRGFGLGFGRRLCLLAC